MFVSSIIVRFSVIIILCCQHGPVTRGVSPLHDGHTVGVQGARIYARLGPSLSQKVHAMFAISLG